TADRNRSHWSTSKTPSYTKSVSWQHHRVPVVFKLKDCKGPAGYNVKVTLTGVEDSEQPGFLALDTSSTAQGVGIGMEKTDGMQVAINNTNGATFALTNGNNDINFRAWLQAKSGRDVTIGEFTASLTATFEYI
ncbi:fimbrial protein, partial [Escherichia coli]|nr:fimbrial protein [Escherichia coli]